VPLEFGAKAMEAVKILNCSRGGLLGVWGAERSDSDGGNWGGPSRPDDLRMCRRSVRPYNR
jgi:hypothetical protein